MREALRFARYLQRSNDGRAHGWCIELAGRPLGALHHMRPEDQFWDSYEVTAHPGADAPLFHPPNWHHNRFTFRSIGYGRAAPNAFPSTRLPRLSGDRIFMRALYLAPTTRLERVAFHLSKALQNRRRPTCP